MSGSRVTRVSYKLSELAKSLPEVEFKSYCEKIEELNSQHWKNYLLLPSDTDSKIQKYKYNYRHVLDTFQVLVATQLAMMS
ncbi:hypothetical protein OUZ56_026320 [Daphnia magna]|uniref:Uncharacterized protein n=1 Tax=Daphnia magna TaxID=35525 RepID=A0ABQ9ZLF3_9CRUS|nr:hypothetical protein OUZ56_026320 [Daphnia magna]